MPTLLARRSSPLALRRAAGFTLIEIVIVVVIVAIMASIALPSYQESLRKGRRADARQALMSVANRQEQYMLDNSTYVQDLTLLGYSASPMISEDKYYQVVRLNCTATSAGTEDGTTAACPMVCAQTTATCYVLQAKPTATSVQKDDKRCTSFSLDSAGAQLATGKDKDNCW